jgi:O-acetyl-ADP-ribose deacetylase (regulator of RNase III)
MKIVLFDNQAAMVEGFTEVFGDELGVTEVFGDEFPFVSVHHGDFKELANSGIEAIVSPANSFGFMDGGIDLAYSEYFGWELQRILQKEILEQKYGELLVGDAVVVEIPNSVTDFKYLISAPTMRVPINVGNTTNAYIAMTSILRVAEQNGIQSIAVPGLGTGVGNMLPYICAKQIYSAVAIRYKLGLEEFQLPSLREQFAFDAWLRSPYKYMVKDLHFVNSFWKNNASV